MHTVTNLLWIYTLAPDAASISESDLDIILYVKDKHMSTNAYHEMARIYKGASTLPLGKMDIRPQQALQHPSNLKQHM